MELMTLLQLVVKKGNPSAFIAYGGFSEALLLPYSLPQLKKEASLPSPLSPHPGKEQSEPNPGPTPPHPAQPQAAHCPPYCLLFVGCPDNNTALLLVHTDTVDILRVGEVSNPPLETHLGVLAHEDGLQKANPTPGLFLMRVGRDAPHPLQISAYRQQGEILSSSPSDASITVTGQALSPCPGMITSKTFGYSFRQTLLEHCAQVGTLEMKR